MLHIAVILAAAVQLVASFRSYAIPNSLATILAESDCNLPENFTVQNFQTWTPAKGNNASETVKFSYVDSGTSISTSCQYNSTSKNVAPAPYLTPRYACDNPVVEFIWGNGTLTLIEQACPDYQPSIDSEAAGAVSPNLTCTATGCSSSNGDGSKCSADAALTQPFTSFEPIPSGPSADGDS